MKNLSPFQWFFTVAFASLLFVSCSDTNKPEQVAQDFLQLYYIDNDFAAAKKFATEASQENLEQRAFLYLMNPVSPENSFNSFEITSVNIKQTRGVVNYTIDGQNRQLSLLKVRRTWLVDAPTDITKILSDFSSSSPSDPDAKAEAEETGTGGFASGESEWVRVGDLPTK